MRSRWGGEMRLLYVCALAVVSWCSLSADVQTPTPDLVHLAAAYVQRFLDGFANVIAEERYTQEATSPARRRTLRSDFVVVRYPGAAQWHVFRDVLEVDGKPVRGEHDGRLARLFLEPADDALRRAQQIASASARHNIQDIGTVNNPLLTLAFLQRGYRDKFRFTVEGLEQSLGPTVRAVRFEETLRPTILRRGGNLDLPAHGLIWIDEPTGRIVKTELRLGERPLQRSSMSWQPPSTITTVFGFDKELGIDVPVEMRDSYPIERADVKGVATYSRFQRFRVRPDETVK